MPAAGQTGHDKLSVLIQLYRGTAPGQSSRFRGEQLLRHATERNREEHCPLPNNQPVLTWPDAMPIGWSMDAQTIHWKLSQLTWKSRQPDPCPPRWGYSNSRAAMTSCRLPTTWPTSSCSSIADGRAGWVVGWAGGPARRRLWQLQTT